MNKIENMPLHSNPVDSSIIAERNIMFESHTSKIWMPQLAQLLTGIIPTNQKICIYEPDDCKLAYLLLQKNYKVGIQTIKSLENIAPNYSIDNDANFLGFSPNITYDVIIFIADFVPSQVQEITRHFNKIYSMLNENGNIFSTAYISENPELDGQIIPGFPFSFFNHDDKHSYSCESLYKFLNSEKFKLIDLQRPEYLNNMIFKATKLYSQNNDNNIESSDNPDAQNIKKTQASKSLFINNKNVSQERFNYINQIKYQRELQKDEIRDYISYLFYKSFGYYPNLEQPKTYNEKLNWLKIHYHNPKLHIMADKARFHSYVLTRLPGYDSHCVKPLAIFHAPDELTNDVLEYLPERFVLKSNFSCGAHEFVDKNMASIGHLKRQISKWLNPQANHYFMALEWGYKGIPPAVICEPVIDFEYKIEFFCFGGEPFIYWIVKNDETKVVHANLYDLNGKRLPVSWHYPNFTPDLPRPPYFDELLHVSRTLSRGLPHMRVDFYAAKDTWYFSEMTFYTWAGLCPLSDNAYDMLLGKKLNLEGICG